MNTISCRLRLLVATIVAVSLFAGCSRGPEPIQGKNIVILERATLIDGMGSAPRPNSVVALAGDRILRVGTTGQFAYPHDAEVLDLQGKWVIPGFIDTHAHMPDSTDQEQVLRTLLAFGITSVRAPAADPATAVELRDRIARGDILGPRMKTAGRLIDVPGGIFSGWAAEVTTGDEIRAEVVQQATEGVDYIKLYRGIPPDLAQVAIEEAHRLGLRVLGHLGATMWGQAAAFGIDGLCHFGIYATPWELAPQSEWTAIKRACDDCGSAGDEDGFRILRERVDAGGPEAARWARELAARGVTVEPNLVLLRAVFWGDDQQVLDSLEPSYMPDAWRDGSWFNAVPHPYRAPCTAEWAAEAQATYPLFESLVVLLHRNGVILSVGTDLMNPWMTPGVSYHREVELLVAAGLSTADALRAATWNGAVALGIEAETGSVEEGKIADLVVLESDPLADIRNTRSIKTVFVRGTRMKPLTLLRSE